MNMAIWASMQTLATLQRVEEMIDVDLEDDLKRLSPNYHSHISRNGNRSVKKNGRTKVATGIGLVAIGLAGLLDPTKAWQARKIQLAFALAGAYVGSLFGMGLAGFGIGAAVGGIVAAVYLYVMPVVSIVTGVYYIVEGFVEMV